MKNIAILIPVYNHIELTKKCVQSLLVHAKAPKHVNCRFEIVLIDDGSTDGTGEWLAAECPEVHVVRGDGNLWWSGSVNAGAIFAKEELGADYLLLWNNDIVPGTDYFKEVDNLVAELDDRAISGSKIYYSGTEKLIWSFGGIFNPRSGKKYMVGYRQLDSDEFDRIIDVDWLPGMGTLVPVHALREIGYWDADTFPQYHGDSDFTFRARTAGYRIRVYPRLKLWNDKSSSGLVHGGTIRGLFDSFTSIRSNTNLRKNILFYRRHATSVLAYRVLMIYYLGVIGGFFKWRILSLAGIRRNVDPV